MRAWVASFLPVLVLAAAFSCSNDEASSEKDAGSAHADAGASHGGGAAPAGSSGAVSTSGGTKSGSGGHDASLGNEPKDGAEGSASDAASSVEGGKDASEVPEAGTPVRGVVQGNPFDGVDDYSVVVHQDGVTFVRIAISDSPNACETQLSIVRSGMYRQSSRGLYIAVSVPGPSVPPGAYHVNATIIMGPSMIMPMVWAGYAHNDDKCAEVDLDSLTGTVLISEVTDRHVTGAFDVMFYDGHMSGAFDAARCDQLLNPGHSDSGTPGCFP
jgi:hypothetical protein